MVVRINRKASPGGNDSVKRQETISGLFFLIVSIGICIHAFRMNIGTLSTPAQGFLPFLSGACLGGFSLWLLLRSPISGAKRPSGDDLREIKLGRIFTTIGVLLTYSLTLSFLGFGVTTFLFFVFFFRTMAGLLWWKVILGAAAVSVISYLFFVVWLQCQLPSGFLGD